VSAISHAQPDSELYEGEDQLSAAEHAKRALVAFDVQDWAAAAREYEAAYKLEQKPEYLWGLAQAQRLGGHYQAAIKTYKSYQRAGVSATQANAAEMMVLKSEAEVAKLELKQAKEQNTEANQTNPTGAPAPKARPLAPSSDATGDAASDPSGGLHIAWFITGAVVTVGLGATSTWSGIDTQNKALDYEKAPTVQAYEDGTGLETRTNVLFGATAVAATATVIIAIFTDWSGGADDEEGAEAGWQWAPSVGRDGGALLLTNHF
jgi:hypothetical protein